MKLENQVCTLEQAKRLKELGVEQKSLFAHCVVMPDPTGEKYYNAILYQSEDEHQLRAPIEVIASAFTVAELGVMLPHKFQYNEKESVCVTNPYDPKDPNKHWMCGILWTASANNGLTVARKYISASTEAEARAAMLIYILENGHTTAEEVNQRLAA